MVFQPSFFNIMTHLLVHIVKEISILGPVFLHNMFPFERYMAVLKKYVRNRSRPECCISKGYGTEEVIEFCIDFINELSPIGVSMSRHEGRMKGKGTLGKKSNVNIPDKEIRKATFMVLQNSSLVALYIEEHMNIVRSENPGKFKTWITRHHIDTFAIWLK
ncbi:putative polyprotein [Panicum miliaceum]|uniref:Polyprotein n=1 Tax=Panicum miliaceum TaxID=4540 RepID=A0A3L6T986_PANMI|nr:putative polyprotein [Panicum miliaceum]